MSEGLRIAIAGASGFVGRALVLALAQRYRVIPLARSVAGQPSAEGVTWRMCDLFNLRATEHALEGADVGVYLVHSMMPPARLTQARFDDLDLICHNFARACAEHGVRHIVYLCAARRRPRLAARGIGGHPSRDELGPHRFRTAPSYHARARPARLQALRQELRANHVRARAVLPRHDRRLRKGQRRALPRRVRGWRRGLLRPPRRVFGARQVGAHRCGRELLRAHRRLMRPGRRRARSAG
ncbi:MAG: NAD(P)H-binding protein [Myxococcales bacterium]|nr:NAD(P)H-binding protein [Myxococcales bacterium]